MGMIGPPTATPGGVESSEIHVWDVATGRLRKTIPVPVAFSLDPVGTFIAPPLVFLQEGTVVAAKNWQGEVTGWSVETAGRVPVAGDPFARPRHDKRTADGRRLWFSNGKLFIQAEPDERERKRLRAQGEPDPAWHAEKARAAEAGKKWFAASFHLGRLLLKSPRDVALLCRRARALIAQQRWEEARKDCDEAILLQSKLAEAWITRALLEYRQGRMEQAHAVLTRAAAAAPDDATVAAWQAFLYEVDGKGELAEAAEKRMLQRLPLLLYSPGQRAFNHLLLDKRRPDTPGGAVLSGKLSPLWPMLKEELTQRLSPEAKSVPLLRLRGAAVAASQGNIFETLNDFRAAVTLKPKDVLAQRGLACAIWPVAEAPGQGWWLKQGIDACDAVLGLEPDAWDVWYLRGLFCALDRQQAAAIEAYTQVLERHPNFVLALWGRGSLYAELGKWDKAVKDFGRAVDLTGPTEPALWDALALAHLGGGDPAAYKQTCARMRALFDRSPPVVWAGGAFAAGPFNPLEAPLALHFADQALQFNQVGVVVTADRCTTLPDTLTDWQRLLPLTKHGFPDVRGKVLCRMGRYDEAVKVLESLRFKPQLNLYRALAEHGRGRTPEAKRLLEETTKWLNRPPENSPLLPPGVAPAPNQKNRDVLPWTERVEIEQLLREVEALLKDKGP
jgi:tetratricopeptide (TPR) repeat protein